MDKDKIIAETITAHDQMLKRLWCIAYEEGQKSEREACAKVCEDIPLPKDSKALTHGPTIERCAAAIRARI